MSLITSIAKTVAIHVAADYLVGPTKTALEKGTQLVTT